MSARCLPLALAAAVLMVSIPHAHGRQGVIAPPDRTGHPQRSVLFIAPDDFTQPYVRLLFEAFSSTVQQGPDIPVLFFEPVDSIRFQDPQYLQSVREWLRQKYRDRRIDLIVPIGQQMLAFLADGQGEPWPAAQVLFLESGSVTPEIFDRMPDAGGVLLEDHFAAAMAVIRTILPETKRVALVYGASAVERDRFGGFAGKVRAVNLEPVEIVGASVEEMRAAVRRLPQQTVVLLLSPNVDAEGRVVPRARDCEVVSTERPTFMLGMQDFGCGIVGGLLRDWAIIGRLVGEEALARLKHASSGVVTVPAARFTTLAFDDRQLQRWGIPERRLPANAEVRFREPGLWRDHRALVLATIAVTALQSLLIAGLVLEHRRRRRAEVESRRNLAAMAHLDRRAAMGELATSLAHELNQPLNAILQNAGVAQMLVKAHGLPPALAEMGEIISDIRKDDIRASEVIRRMRGLLQKQELEAHPVDLNDVAQETVAIVWPDARSRDVQLEVELQQGISSIQGDRVHLQQVLLNLLINAMDAVSTLPPEQRRVRVWTKQEDGEVRLAVADSGSGIPGDSISEIFEPFYTTKSKGGMGMGLAIARSIVEAHSGRMAAENNTTGGGATVWFSVPTAPGEPS
jgi:signal transduction histidine kinase